MLLHPARGTSFCFLEWRGEKEVLPESCQTLPEHWTSQSCFPVLNWFYEYEHRFVNKPWVIAEPTVPSTRLLGLDSRLYPSNMPRMPNKDRTRFKQRLSRRATIEQVNARRCSQSDVVHTIFIFQDEMTNALASMRFEPDKVARLKDVGKSSNALLNRRKK